MTETEYKNLKRGDKLRVNHWLYGFSISGIINLSIEPGTILTFHTKTKFDELMSTNNCISFKEYGKDDITS